MEPFRPLLLTLYALLVSGTSFDYDNWMRELQTKDVVCYNELGCFDLSGPWLTWNRPVPVLPQSPDVINTTFYLVTRANNTPRVLPVRPRVDVTASGFDRDKWTMLIVHGFFSSYDSDWVTTLYQSILDNLCNGSCVNQSTAGLEKAGNASCRCPSLMMMKDHRCHCYWHEATPQSRLDHNTCITLPQLTQFRSQFVGKLNSIGCYEATFSKLYDVNIIMVDWSNAANTLNYIQAVADARLVGAEVTRFIFNLQLQGLVDPQKIHGIGHSLGAQILSYVAKNITIHRITGLEPAQPGFEGTDPLVRLDPFDANFVDVIHTNGISFLFGMGFGMRQSVGDVDFFVNGGEFQPSCPGLTTKSRPPASKEEIYHAIQHFLANHAKLNVHVNSVQQVHELANGKNGTRSSPYYFNILEFLMGQIIDISSYLSCSHNRAQEYLIETIKYRNCSFWGFLWHPYDYPSNSSNCSEELCTEMGINSILYPARGNYYVPTRLSSPYCEWKPDVEVLMKNRLADHFLYQAVSLN